MRMVGWNAGSDEGNGSGNGGDSGSTKELINFLKQTYFFQKNQTTQKRTSLDVTLADVLVTITAIGGGRRCRKGWWSNSGGVG